MSSQSSDPFTANWSENDALGWCRTRLAPQTGLIRVGSGRDAADTSFATIFWSREVFIDESHDGIATRPSTHLYDRRYLDFVVVREGTLPEP